MKILKSWTSILTLVLWCSVQLIDVCHHVFEEHEQICEIGEEHFCEPHCELEICDLCTVVHGASITSSYYVSSKVVLNPNRHKSFYKSVDNRLFQPVGNPRGPPIVV
jgi:hypothetical protein